MFTTSTRNLDYNPNKEIVLRKLTHNFSIKSMTSRKELFDVKQIPESITYSIKSISRKSLSTDFSKLQPRAKDSNSSVPIFMQGLANRASLNTITHKTLQQNSYSSHKMYTQLSSFNKPRRKKVEKDVFNILKEHLLDSA